MLFNLRSNGRKNHMQICSLNTHSFLYFDNIIHDFDTMLAREENNVHEAFMKFDFDIMPENFICLQAMKTSKTFDDNIFTSRFECFLVMCFHGIMTCYKKNVVLHISKIYTKRNIKTLTLDLIYNNMLVRVANVYLGQFYPLANLFSLSI